MQDLGILFRNRELCRLLRQFVYLVVYCEKVGSTLKVLPTLEGIFWRLASQ